MLQDFLYIPSGLPLKEIMPSSLSKYTEDACYFIHKIYEQRVLNIRHREEFVPLKAQYLRKVISERKYTDIRAALLASKVVETDGKYIKGEKCMGYRLGSNWMERKHRKLNISSKRLISSMEKARIRSESHLTDDQKKMLNLLKTIKIINGAEKLIPLSHSRDQLQANRTSISLIEDGLWYLIPDRYGRVHTNITNLSSHLRKALRVSGQPLVEIDIRNSQPFFFGLLLILYFTNRHKLSSYNTPSPPPSLTMRHFPPDVSMYLELVREGVFYSYIADRWEIPLHKMPTFKVSLFSEVFFCENYKVGEKAKLFMQEFPNVYEVIKKIKEKDYKRLAIQLQKIESSFILNKVARAFVDNLPGEFIATIHDSILVNKENKDIVRDIIDLEFRPWGMVPSLKIKEY